MQYRAVHVLHNKVGADSGSIKRYRLQLEAKPYQPTLSFNCATLNIPDRTADASGCHGHLLISDQNVAAMKPATLSE